MRHVVSRLAKIPAHLRLLKTDPERFFRNWRHTRDPAAYRREMLEIERVIEPSIRIDTALVDHPTLNIMLPNITQLKTGGPNTAVQIAYQIASAGIPVRLVSMNASEVIEPDWLWTHLRTLVGSDVKFTNLSLGHCGAAEKPLRIGANDMFLATYWTTARAIACCLEHTNIKEFFYLIQDFEPAFFPWSSNYALALDTYGMNFRAIINEKSLADYFCRTGTGRFADPTFIDRCTVFQPAVDRRFFYNEPAQKPRPRRLLVYARPGRNLRGICYESLCLAAAHSVFDSNWEFLSIGGTGLAELELANNKSLRPAPWMSFIDYAGLMRSSDILLCLMLSPHTSYPTLEMVASGGITVTNTFATKTQETFQALSPNFIVARPDPQSIAASLIEAAQRVTTGYDRDAPLALPQDWHKALEHTTAEISEIFRSCTDQAAPAATPPAPPASGGGRNWSGSASADDPHTAGVHTLPGVPR